MKTNTYVNFHGNCTQAFQYYEKHLGAKIGMMMTHAQSPGQSQVPSNWKDAVVHGRISLADAEVWAADIPNAEPMRSAYLTLRMDTDIEAERAFSALSDGGQVFVPMREELFASRFGQVRDRFGINWMILHERPMPQQQ
ncbi:MAG: VOC family protein [Acidobacteria bacterium]|nr:MAG: VOC family protein [Acidobacteriota bacterium]